MSDEPKYLHGHSALHIPHSTFSTFLPQIHAVFPITPLFAPKYAILAHFCNRLTIRRLASDGPVSCSTPRISHDQKPSFEARNMPFRGSFSYLSHLESLAIATRKMPNATGGPPFSAFRSSCFAFSRAISAKNPTQVFCHFFLLLVVECGVGMGSKTREFHKWYNEKPTNGIMKCLQMV